MKTQFAISILIILLAAFSMPGMFIADTGVQGQVFIGPMCPVAEQGDKCPDQPYQATLTINDSDGKQIAQVTTDKNGRFKLPLEPGEYILHPESAIMTPYASDRAFVVEAGRFTQIIVTYDNEIR